MQFILSLLIKVFSKYLSFRWRLSLSLNSRMAIQQQNSQ